MVTFIEISELKKSFGDLTVLDNVSFGVESGKVTGLVGPNASGKTTLIKCILGLVSPSKGEIRINGARASGAWSHKSMLGYMPQIARFPDNLTLSELLSFLSRLRKGTSMDKELIETFELEPSMNRPIRTLSGGTRQKISACIAFLFDPQAVILDEPTAGLDPVSSIALKEKILQEKTKGKTILLTSHVMSEVEELSDRIVVLLNGKVFFDESAAELKETFGEEKLDRAVAKLMKGARCNIHA